MRGGVVQSRLPPTVVSRTDPRGRSISLLDTPPRGNAVLFTGAPGMGKSVELNRTHEHAREQDWTVLRVDASPREPLENRFIRAVGDQLGALRKQHGFWAVRKLKKMLRDLSPPDKNSQNGAEMRFGVPGAQVVAKRQWAAPGAAAPGTTLNELADRLAELSARQGKPAIIMIDNVDVASDRDLAAVNELAGHLKATGHVFLVASGGEQATTRLMNASRGQSGVETGIGQRYDIRECRPLLDEELRPVLTTQLIQRGIPADPAAVDTLVQSANGSPQRLAALSQEAVRLARPPYGLSTDVASMTVSTVNAQSRLYYEAAWNNSSATEKSLLAQAAVRGERGLSLPAVSRAAGIDKFAAIDTARQSLKARGLLRDTGGGRVKFSDPGMRDWIRAHVGDSFPHQSVSVQAVIGKVSAERQGIPRGTATVNQALTRANGGVAPPDLGAAQPSQVAQPADGARPRTPATVDRRAGGRQR